MAKQPLLIRLKGEQLDLGMHGRILTAGWRVKECFGIAVGGQVPGWENPYSRIDWTRHKPRPRNKTFSIYHFSVLIFHLVFFASLRLGDLETWRLNA